MKQEYQVTCDSLPSRKRSMPCRGRARCRSSVRLARTQPKPVDELPGGSDSEKITRWIGIAPEVVGEIYSDSDSTVGDVFVDVGDPNRCW